jgi:hypothetical protein
VPRSKFTEKKTGKVAFCIFYMLKKCAMNFRKRHVPHLFFLICFAFYVMSPFCYVGNQLFEKDAYAYTGSSTGSSICVVWELLLSGLFKKGNSESGQSGVNFLIKKARAVLGQNGPDRMPVTAGQISLPEDPVSGGGGFAYLLQNASSFPEDGFHFSFSGLSPPFEFIS